MKTLYNEFRSIKENFTTSWLFFFLFSLLGFSGSAKCQQVLLSNDSKLKNIIIKNFKYPEEAKQQGIEGDFYVIVKMNTGKIEKLSIINKDKKIEQPIIITASIIDKTKSNTTSITNNYVSRPLSLLEDEAIRVIKLFQFVNNLEWNNKMKEFAILFKFRLK